MFTLLASICSTKNNIYYCVEIFDNILILVPDGLKDFISSLYI